MYLGKSCVLRQIMEQSSDSSMTGCIFLQALYNFHIGFTSRVGDQATKAVRVRVGLGTSFMVYNITHTKGRIQYLIKSDVFKCLKKIF